MAKALPVDKLESEIRAILDKYGDDIDAKMDVAVQEVTRVGTNDLKANARLKIKSKNRKYANGFRYTIERKRLYTIGTIYQHAKPGLPHLLENSHVIKNGTGRTFGKTSPGKGQVLHIKEIEDKIIEEFDQMVKVKLT